MKNIPGGTITFLFTDIEGSTSLWEAYPDGMQSALRQHDRLLRQAIEAQGGYVFKTMAAMIEEADGESCGVLKRETLRY